MCTIAPTVTRPLVAKMLASLISAAALSACAIGGGAARVPAPERYGPIDRVPSQFLGEWVRVREQCYPDADAVARTDLLPSRITISANRRYVFVHEGRTTSGRLVIERFRDGIRLRMAETLLDFHAVEGRLENWGEGDAAYICGQIYERAPQ